MITRKYLLQTTILAALAWSATTVMAADIQAGKTKSSACAACHGTDGNSMVPTFPKLAGQHANYIEKQLKDFKSGARKDPIMVGQVAALSDDDMRNLAAFFHSQKTKAGAVVDAKAGEKIYKGGNTATGVTACMACHGPTGAGNPAAKFPKLASQQAAYIEKQLKDFKTGIRTNDAAQMMRNIATKMTDDEIKAVSAYIATLQP